MKRILAYKIDDPVPRAQRDITCHIIQTLSTIWFRGGSSSTSRLRALTCSFSSKMSDILANAVRYSRANNGMGMSLQLEENKRKNYKCSEDIRPPSNSFKFLLTMKTLKPEHVPLQQVFCCPHTVYSATLTILVQLSCIISSVDTTMQS